MAAGRKDLLHKDTKQFLGSAIWPAGFEQNFIIVNTISMLEMGLGLENAVHIHWKIWKLTMEVFQQISSILEQHSKGQLYT